MTVSDSTTGAATPVDVLYIVGLWRSGSTILDIVLGNHERLESVGELRNLPGEGWLGAEVCSCGQPASSCERWSEVRRIWSENVGGDKAARLLELQNRFERLRSIPLVLAASSLRASRDFREYAFLVGALYRAIAKASGKSVIVDSTKYPARAIALLRTPGIRLHVVHLVRDGRAVIWSYHRKPNVDFQGNVIGFDKDEVARWVTTQWLWVNGLSNLAARLAGKRAIRVRYEDVVTRPDTELERIGQLLGIDMTPVAAKLAGGETLDVGHMIAGNRVRHEGAIRLKADVEWQEKLPDADRRAFWSRAGWLARSFGYAE